MRTACDPVNAARVPLIPGTSAIVRGGSCAFTAKGLDLTITGSFIYQTSMEQPEPATAATAAEEMDRGVTVTRATGKARRLFQSGRVT